MCGEPILKYADTSKPYTLYTDASNYDWAGVLTQSHTMDIDGKSVTTEHPPAFVSGLFRGSQLDWAALTKEAFAIHMSVKKLSFYSDQSQIILRSDHLPLKRSLQKNTLNSKVNNWAMELESFNIKFKYIQGFKNVLADTLSRLIDINEDTQFPPEEQGYEFVYAVFEDLPKIKTFQVNEVIVGDKEIKNDPDLADTLQCITNPLSMERMKWLQEQDPDIQNLKHKLKHNKLDKEYYKMEDDLLKLKVVDGGHEFWSIYLPCSLVLQVAHNDLGHNGFPRTYAAVKWVFYWKNIKENVQQHCKLCPVCTLLRSEYVKFERKLFHPSMSPMDFIYIDLIGEFHPSTRHGHYFALTACCMLTGFTWCIPLKTKTADEVVTAYKNDIACPFRGSVKILTDNGTEFKNKLFKEVVAKLGTEMSIHLPPYRPQSYGKIEGFHRFLKACIAKYINHRLEWDELTPMAMACYTYFPNCSAQESAFFLMFDRDPINKLNQMLHEAMRYFHDENGIPDLEALKNIYQVVAQKLLNSRECYMKKHHNQKPVESSILTMNHTAKALQPKYKKGTYRVVNVHGNQVDIRDFRGNISMVHITDVKKTTLRDKVANDYLQLCNEGRFTKKCVPRGYIADLDWTTIHNDPDHPIKPVKQKKDPSETTATPDAPKEVEGPPSSCLRSKTKRQTTTIRQEQLEHNPALVDPPECNQAKLEVNQVVLNTGSRNSLVHYTLTLLGVTRTISDQL